MSFLYRMLSIVNANANSNGPRKMQIKKIALILSGPPVRARSAISLSLSYPLAQGRVSLKTFFSAPFVYRSVVSTMILRNMVSSLTYA